MIRRPPRSTQSRSSAASDVYKRQVEVMVGARTVWPTVLVKRGSVPPCSTTVHLGMPDGRRSAGRSSPDSTTPQRGRYLPGQDGDRDLLEDPDHRRQASP